MAGICTCGNHKGPCSPPRLPSHLRHLGTQTRECETHRGWTLRHYRLLECHMSWARCQGHWGFMFRAPCYFIAGVSSAQLKRPEELLQLETIYLQNSPSHLRSCLGGSKPHSAAIAIALKDTTLCRRGAVLSGKGILVSKSDPRSFWAPGLLSSTAIPSSHPLL